MALGAAESWAEGSRQPGAPTPSRERRGKQAVLGQTPMKLTIGGDTTKLGSVLFALRSAYVALTTPLDKPQSQPQTPATPGYTMRPDQYITNTASSPSVYWSAPLINTPCCFEGLPTKRLGLFSHY